MRRSIGLVISVVIASALFSIPTRALGNDDWLADLQAADGAVRDRALAELPRRLLDADALRQAIQAAEGSPEVEMRVRAAVASSPFLAPYLAAAAAGSEEPVAKRARSLLVEALTFEVARRAPSDRLLKRTERSRLFMAGALVGALPPLEGATSLEQSIAWLARNGGWSVPLALDPRLAGDRVAPVKASEWWPSTAGGTLKRWLAQRALGVIDLGLVAIVTSSSDVSAFERADREAEDASRHGLGFEQRAGAWLAERLVDPAADPRSASARLRLWLALGLLPPPFAPMGSAASVDRMPELRALSALAEVQSEQRVDRCVEVLLDSPPELRVAIVYELGNGCSLPERAKAALVARGLDFEAAYLDGKERFAGREDDLVRIAGGDRRTVTAQLVAAISGARPLAYERAVEWLTTESRGAAECDSSTVALAWATSRWRFDSQRLDRLRDGTNPQSRFIAWFAAGCAVARGEDWPTAKLSAHEREAFALGLTFCDLGRATPRRNALILELSSFAFRDSELAILAWARHSSTTDLLASLGTLRQASSTRLSWAAAVHHRGVIDLLENDDRLCTRLLFELRRVEDPTRELNPLYEDASAAFGAEERGTSSLVSPIDRVWLSR